MTVSISHYERPAMTTVPSTLVEQVGGDKLTDKMIEYTRAIIKKPSAEVPQGMKADFIEMAIGYATTDMEFNLGTTMVYPEKDGEMRFWSEQGKKNNALAHAGLYYAADIVCNSYGFFESMAYGDTGEIEALMPRLKTAVEPLDKILEEEPCLAGNSRAKLAAVYKMFLTDENNGATDAEKDAAFNFMMIETSKGLKAEDIKARDANVYAEGMFQLAQTIPHSFVDEKTSEIEECSAWKLFQENKKEAEAYDEDAWGKLLHKAGMKITGLDMIVKMVEHQKKTGETIVLA